MVFHDDQEALLAAAPDGGHRDQTLWDTIIESKYFEAIDSVECYDPATNTWEPRASMPVGVGYAASCVIGGRLYVAGGDRGPGTGKSLTSELRDEIQAGGMGIQGCLQAYDPSTDTIPHSYLCLRRRGRRPAVVVRAPAMRQAGRQAEQHGVGPRDSRIGSPPPRVISGAGDAIDAK